VAPRRSAGSGGEGSPRKKATERPLTSRRSSIPSGFSTKGPSGTSKPLRAVADGEKAPPSPRKPRTKTVKQAASSGTQRELLVAMKARVADAVENPNTPARDLAALTKRLMEIARDIEAIDAREAEEARESAEATADDEWHAV
jgi:hypothetical protein